MSKEIIKIVEQALDSMSNEAVTEETLTRVIVNAVGITIASCMNVCENVQVRENGVAIVGKHQQMKYVKAIRDHFGLGELQ